VQRLRLNTGSDPPDDVGRGEGAASIRKSL